MEEILANPKKIRQIIKRELQSTAKKYGQPRKTMFYHANEEEEIPVEDETPDYPVTLFLSSEGYFKKITPQSLRMSGEQKVKEGDFISQKIEATNKTELLFFSDKTQVYKTNASTFDDAKASILGDYIPVKLGFDEEEHVSKLIATMDYSGMLIFVYENGKCAKVPLSAYETKTNRKKLANAFSDKSPLVSIFWIPEDTDLLIRSTSNRAILFNTSQIPEKSTRSTQGVQVINLQIKHKVASAEIPSSERLEKLEEYRVKNIPVAGKIAKDLEEVNQLPLI